MPVTEAEKTVKAAHPEEAREKLEYFDAKYDTKDRFCSYWHQVDEAKSAAPSEILEIGKGNGFFSTYMRNRNAKVVSLDFDFRVRPECNASVVDIPFKTGSFDLVVCYEVLEHMPFDLFVRSVRELHRVSRRRVVVSLPDLSPVWRYLIKIPKLGELKFLLPKPLVRPIRWEFNGDHYWNLGTRGFPVQRVLDIFAETGFQLRKNYRVFEIPWHRFFVLEKKS